ncbi:hypothetical protein FisN_25Lh174 [Fistulifera solaris]|uniref:Sulfite exporter TauE/SafE n=1 Tax=Fistulifera solaris TaxID=1519565 RepID=A0A1Z5KR64_FISSO|nr:hypothetical protein FisN_25Lh174 [Fistulifera solaris]|eukprot:GAX28769.1 hypothetical protein FisN_25Lh174 [Fistulifera solaris]
MPSTSGRFITHHPCCFYLLFVCEYPSLFSSCRAPLVIHTAQKHSPIRTPFVDKKGRSKVYLTMTSHHHHQYKTPHVIAARGLLCLSLIIGGMTAVIIHQDKGDISQRVLTLIDDRVTLDPLFPLHGKDYWGFFLAILGLVIAAGGGIGGGGILVPIYILILKFPVKYAISLSGVTVLGGAVANNLVNYSKSHPDDEKRNTTQPKRPSVDWDLLLQLEPPAMAGTVLGAALNAVLPSIVLIVLLLALLVFTAYKTLTKAMQLYDKETKRLQEQQRASSQHEQSDETKSMLAKDTTYGALSVPHGEAESPSNFELRNEVWKSICKMTVLFAIITVLSLLEGRSEGGESSGNIFRLPQCDIRCHWYSQLSMLVIIVLFGVWTRTSILHRVGVQGGPILSDIDWDDSNTIHYPMYAILAGIVAGLFGIGGGMVKGPLMLELNVHPTVASATTAAMILFTSATATIRYCMYGFVQYDYAVVCFAIGFLSTMFGQSIMSFLMKRHDRPSYIAFSIGIVVAVSAVCMTVESISAIRSG